MDNTGLLGVAVVVATIVAALGALGQMLGVIRQVNLQEAETYQAQASAWRDLKDHFSRLVLAGLGPTNARRAGFTDPSDHYRIALTNYRAARVRTQYALDSDKEDVIDDAFRAESSAWESLEPYEASVRTVLIHLCQTANLILRRRLTVAAVYDALGHDVLAQRQAIWTVTRHAYDYGGCVAPTNQEGRLWARLTPDEVSPRIGWARALETSIGSLDRLDILVDMLEMRAWGVGDGDRAMDGQFDLSVTSSRRRLAYRCRVLRRVGLFRAIGFCSKALYIQWKEAGSGRPSWVWEVPKPLRVVYAAIWPLGRALCWPFWHIGQLVYVFWLSRRATDGDRWLAFQEDAGQSEAEPPMEADSIPGING